MIERVKMSDQIPHLRTSERKDFKRCQAKWSWRWRSGLVPRFTKPDALWFGTGIHLALQHRYSYPGLRRGTNVLKVWRDYVGEEMGSILVPGAVVEEDQWFDAKALGEAMLGAYLDFYGKDERWHVISAEQTFELPIPFPLMGVAERDCLTGSRPTLVLYNGTFDLVARDLEGDDSLWLWDHKTAKTIRTQHLPLDDQAGSYWAVAGDVLSAQGLIRPGDKLDGILYNFLRKGVPDPRPVNAEGLATNKPTKAHYLARLEEAGWWKPIHAKMRLDELQNVAAELDLLVLGDVSKVQPAPLFHREEVWRTAAERKTQIRKIQNEALQMEAIRNKRLPITKNPTPDCAFDCPFYQMCELHEAQDDWKEFRDVAFVRSDPYLAHRKSTED